MPCVWHFMHALRRLTRVILFTSLLWMQEMRSSMNLKESSFDGNTTRELSSRIRQNSKASTPMASNNSVEKNSIVLTFHKGKRSIVTEAYLKHVLEEGEAIEYRNSSRKLYANHGYEGTWSCINFEHPTRFDTLAMDPKKKQEIIGDLKTFTKGKDYYAKIGKAWKRGYLLYGPP